MNNYIDINIGGRSGKTQAMCIALKEYADKLGATAEKPLRIGVVQNKERPEWAEDMKKNLEERLFSLGTNNVSFEIVKPKEEKPKLIPIRDTIFDFERGIY